LSIFVNRQNHGQHGFLIFNTDVADLADFADVFQKNPRHPSNQYFAVCFAIYERIKFL